MRLVALGLLLLTLAPQARPADGELRRRALFGAQLAPATDGGILLEKIFPGTAAAEAEFKAGDVILAIGDVKVTGVPMFLATVAKARAGDVLTFDVARGGVRGKRRATLKEMPREKGDGYDVLYSSVTSHGARLRTIITRPKAAGRHPAVVLLQGGHTCFPIDTPVGQPGAFTWIASDLTRHGYVTLRVERPGCGDSEGGPLRDVDFDTELDGYKEALRALKRLDFVDADSVFLFGHSMGGIMAPLIATDVPVRGIAVFGTAVGTWFEAVFGQRRRLASLDGTKPADVDREMLAQARFWYPLVVEKKTPVEIRKNTDLPKRVWEQWVSDEKYVGDRHYKFHHQLAEKNLAESWTKVATKTRVLAIWGTSDWLSTTEQAEGIAKVVNGVKPGNGTFVALKGIDHFFFQAGSPQESYRTWKAEKGTPPGKFNPVLREKLRAWLDETAKEPLAGFDAYVRAALADWRVPGMAVAVIKDGKVVLARGYGVRRAGTTDAVDDHTVFPIASVSKVFTATCLAQLVEEGRLKWSDPVVEHWPGFKLSDPYLTRNVQVADLLAHRTGLETADLVAYRGDLDRAGILGRLPYLQPTAPFRSRLVYNNMMYLAAAQTLERVAKEPWSAFLESRLLKPLGMNATVASPRGLEGRDNVSTPHVLHEGRPVPDPAWGFHRFHEAVAPAGGIQSNVVDMARFVQLFLSEGAAPGGRVLRVATVREMQAPHSVVPIKVPPTPNFAFPRLYYGAGLGWHLRDYRGRKVVYHGGSSGAVAAFMPEENLGVVVLANRGCGLVYMVMHDTFDRLLGIPRTWTNRDWLFEGEGKPEQERKEKEARLEAKRVKDTSPSLPLAEYAGTYECALYGKLVIREEGGSLVLRMGPNIVAPLRHWEHDTFRGKLSFPADDEWSVRFVLSDGKPVRVQVERLYWHEPMPAFRRVH